MGRVVVRIDVLIVMIATTDRVGRCVESAIFVGVVGAVLDAVRITMRRAVAVPA